MLIARFTISFRTKLLVRNLKGLSTVLYTTPTTKDITLSMWKTHTEELISLRGQPELIDKLEALTIKYPGIEVSSDLYQLFFPFALDDFQLRGLQSLIEGNNVLVMTPTGSGKTIVGELAIYFALMMRLRVVYTTPLKALSNQKFQDFRRRFGGDRVGLLTGEVSINKFAPIVVMTTEVLRNMIYDSEVNSNSREALSNIFMICFDEFHYMNDPDRGTVWEECIISCPPSIRMLALSATVGNIHEIKDWISSIHGPTEIIQSDYRPVPLRYLYALRSGLFPLFRDPNAGPGSLHGLVKRGGNLDPGCRLNPSIARIEADTEREQGNRNRHHQSRKQSDRKKGRVDPTMLGRMLAPSYNKIIEELFKLRKLPAIFFIFSRDGCEEAARMAASLRLPLLDRSERQYIEEAINNFMLINPLIPVTRESVELLRKGISVHHAGLMTVWKSLIEELFIANKIKVLFATETLAAGVNMPARTTIISSITKKIGPKTSILKTSQVLQMAGRAGRRGKDTEGTVVLMRNRFDPPSEAHRILTAPIDGISSQFKASYAFVIKLLSTKSLPDCRALIERGFGTFIAQKIAKRRKQRELSRHFEELRLHPVLMKYPLDEMKAYMRLIQRIKKEKKTLDYLIAKNLDTDQELIEVFTDYMSIGSVIQLKSGVVGYFLGDMVIDGDSITFFSDLAKKLQREKDDLDVPQFDLTNDEENIIHKTGRLIQSFLSPKSETETAPSSSHSSTMIVREDLAFQGSVPANQKATRRKQSYSSRRIPAYGLFTVSGEFLCFQREDIQYLISLDHPLQKQEGLFGRLIELIRVINGWQRVPYQPRSNLVTGSPLISTSFDEINHLFSRPVNKGIECDSDGNESKEENCMIETHPASPSCYYYRARYDPHMLQKFSPQLFEAMQYLQSYPLDPSITNAKDTQSRNYQEILQQEEELIQLQQQYLDHRMTRNNDTSAIQDLFQDLAERKNNKEVQSFLDHQKRLLQQSTDSGIDTMGDPIVLEGDSDVWKMFLEVVGVLETFGAIRKVNITSLVDDTLPIPNDANYQSDVTRTKKRLTYTPTDFGEMIGSLATDNDLWVASVLRHPALEQLNGAEFASLMAAITCDSSKATTAFYRYPTSPNVTAVIEQLLPQYQRLYDIQLEKDIDYPIVLSSEICGLIEAWAKGLTWLELCQATSLEQGDLYRILKRTIEVLRSVLQAYEVAPEIVEKARDALLAVNRFPLVESIEDDLESVEKSIGPSTSEAPEELSHSEVEEEEREEESWIETLDAKNAEDLASQRNRGKTGLFDYSEEDFLPISSRGKASDQRNNINNDGTESRSIDVLVDEIEDIMNGSANRLENEENEYNIPVGRGRRRKRIR